MNFNFRPFDVDVKRRQKAIPHSHLEKCKFDPNAAKAGGLQSQCNIGVDYAARVPYSSSYFSAGDNIENAMGYV
jgi:hypothetical protein